MKQILSCMTMLFLAGSTFAQGIVDTYYSDLQDKPEATTVYVSSAMFEMAAKVELNADDHKIEQMQDFIHSVTSLSVVKVPGLDNATELYKQGIATLSTSHDELVRVRDKNTRISVLVDEVDDVIYELAVLGVVDGEFLAVSLLGEMDLDLISDFVNEMQGESIAGLSNLKEVGVTKMKVYPNPVANGSHMTCEVPEGMIGGLANILDTNGQLVTTIDANTGRLSIPTVDFPSGSYVIELVKDGTSLRQKVLVLD